MRNWPAIAVAVCVFGALSGVAAYESAVPPLANWQEIAWPFPRDGWPAGRAFRCEQQRRRSSDAAPRPGDHRHFAVKPQFFQASSIISQPFLLLRFVEPLLARL